MKTLLLIATVICSLSAQAQIGMLLGKTEIQVTSYFNLLNSIKGKSKIQRSVADKGALMLINEFGADNVYYSCHTVATLFRRIEGVEYCVLQNIFGNSIYAQKYLAYIKDNYTNVSEGVWEYNYTEKLKVKATFSTTGKFNDVFNIEYLFVNR